MAASGKKVDYQFVEDLPEELTCSICMKVLCQPHLVNCCEQQFCKQCLNEWCRKNKTCPHCRSTDFSTILLKQKTRKVGQLKVYCPNKKHSCKAELKISEYDSHLSLANNKGCSYVLLDCPNDCKAKVFRGEMETHTREKCPNRIVSCEWCKLEGEYQLVAGEHLKKCPSFPLPCPLGCGVELIRKDLESHHSTCPLELVPCPLRGLGCMTKVCRKDLDKHTETSTLQHMTKLAKSHTTLQAEHKALQTGQRALQTEHRSLQAGYRALQAEHAALQNKLMAVTTLLSDKQIAKIHAILTESSTLTIGRSLTLAVSDTPGYHYIILSQIFPKPDHKFKLFEWKFVFILSQPNTLSSSLRIKLHFISEAAYPKMTAETSFNISFNSHTIQVCCGKPQGEMQQEDNLSTLINTFHLKLQEESLMIKFSPHNPCHNCHPTGVVSM